ncbi:MAG: hypothetical protein AAGC45_10620 [Bacteroidota bacterium]
MEITKHSTKALKTIGFLLLFIFSTAPIRSQVKEPENLIFWHIKAVRPEAQLLDIKAIDDRGVQYDVKAIQDSHDISLLSVKALVKGQSIPIKMIVKDEGEYYPIKAIDYEGKILDVKAIDNDGTLLDVKGVSRMGNTIEVRALDKDGAQLDVISISPLKGINHVKGLKMFSEDVEAVVRGHKIFAHVKSLNHY